MSFWGELKRRNVFKVGAAYAIVAWLLAQIVSLAFQAFQMPQWTVTFVVSLLVIGFPIALILAWAYEMTPEGVKLTKKVPLSESVTHVTGKKLNYILAVLLVVAVALLIFDNYYLDRRVVESEVNSTVAEKAPAPAEVEEAPKTIAVLPFADMSPEKDQEYFVDGLSEEILNSLCQIPQLGVTGRTSSFSFKGSNKTIQDIANELGVDHILEGGVRKAGNALRITTTLIRASDGLHLWSMTYDKEFKVEEMFSVQEDIANNVADKLKLTLEAFNLVGGTNNLEAYELYLASKGQFSNYELDQALESINAAITFDPKFALAWALKASIHKELGITKPAKNSTVEKDSLLHAALKAIEIEPSLGQAYLSLGLAKLSKGDFIGAEWNFRKGMELATGPISPSECGLLSQYGSVGYFEKWRELSEMETRNDPLNKSTRSAYMRCLGLLGDMQQAEEEYERGKALFGDQWMEGDFTIMCLRLGAKDVISPNDIPEQPFLEPVLSTAMKYLDSPEKALMEIRQIYNNDEVSAYQYGTMAMFAAYFGDSEFALDTFIDKIIPIEASSIYFTWAPFMKEARKTTRFKTLIRDIGLVDYWNEFGWPDICRPLDNGDFVCD